MRFLYKRPKVELVYDEIEDVLDVMASDVFILLDLFVFSLIFTFLLSPVIPTFGMKVLFFVICYSLFSSLYFFIFKRITFNRK